MATNPALWTSTAQTEMYRFFAVAFNAAPGTTYMDQLYDAVTSGMSTEQIVEVFTSKSQFTNVYPRFMSNKDFATKLVNNVVGSSATDAAKATAVADIEAALASGYSRGKVVYQIFTNLANKTADDATWAGTAKQMANQVAVSKYYTETLLQGGENLATLQKVIAGVTKDTAVGTTAALQSIIDTAVPTPGQTFTLTASTDRVTGSSGPDVITGSDGSGTATNNTFSVNDVIDGGAGSDTLIITNAGLLASTPAGFASTYTPTNITNVETLVLQPTGDRTMSVTLTGVKGVETISAAAPAAAVTVNKASATQTFAASSSAQDVAFNVNATTLTGASDTAKISLNGFTGKITVASDAASTGDYEAATVTASGVASVPAASSVLGSTSIKTLTVDGDATINFATNITAQLASVKTLNASANSGGVTFTATAVNTALTGGSGKDSLIGSTGNDTIMGGAGADTLNAGAGNDSVDGGAGDDTVTLTTASFTVDDTVDGGDGVDVLLLDGAVTSSTTSVTGTNVKNFETIRNSASLTQDMLMLPNSTFSKAVLGASMTLQSAPAITAVDFGATSTFTMTMVKDGTADSLTIGVKGSADVAATLNATQVETISVNSTGTITTGNSLTTGATSAGTAATATAAAVAGAAQTATSLKEVTITGDKSFTLTTAATDTALTKVTATAFTGDALTIASGSNKAAMTVLADGPYQATVTTGEGNDTITVSDGGTGLKNTVTSNKGNDTIVSGGGADTISSGEGNDSITSGGGADSVIASDGNDWVSAGAGNDYVSGGAGNDTIDGSDGQDTLDGGTGSDSIMAGAGNDSVIGDSGNDFLSGGDGSDTLTGGVGDDTIDGGSGNDTITITSLTNGDSIDGGTGDDRLDIGSIQADATPSGISGIEDFRITSLGTSSAITVDFTKVSGITSITTTNATSGVTTTLKNLPSTLTSLTTADSGTTDTLALTFASAPSKFTLNANAVSNTATNLTSLQAPLTINGVLTTDIAGETRVYTSNLASNVGNMTTDATSLTVTVGSLSSKFSGQELTVGTVTANSISALSVSSNTNADVTFTGLGTNTSPDLNAVTLSAGTNSTLTTTNPIVNNTTQEALTYTANVASGGAIAGAVSHSFTSSAVKVVADVKADVVGGNAAQVVIGKSISGATYTVGAGVGTSSAYALPTIEVGAATGTIGNVSIDVSSGSRASLTVGNSTTKAATHGTITLTGSGRVDLTVNGTTGTSAATSTTPASQGTISASGMTSSTSVANITATAASLGLSIVGGAGDDTIAASAAADTITGGAGADALNGGAGGNNLFVYAAGDSNAKLTVGAGVNTGQDVYNANFDTGDVIRVPVVMADSSFLHGTDALVGTGTGASLDGVATSFANTTVLIQAGNIAVTDGTDPFEYAITFASNADAVLGLAALAYNITGTVGDDSILGGGNNDTISGGLGNNTIDGGAGNDSITGGSANDTISGGTGADTLNGGAGNDNITGGDGADRIDFSTGTDTYVHDAADDSYSGTVTSGTTVLSGSIDVVTGAGNGDIFSFALTTAFAAAISSQAPGSLITLADGTASGLAIVRGTYSTSTGKFTAGTAATDDDYLLQVQDAEGASTDTLHSVVLLDVVGTVSVSATTAGVITLGVSG